MKQIIQHMPGYRRNEYMLVLTPHEELRNRIFTIKREFYDNYKAPTAIGGKPHLALVKFDQLEMMEERIVNRLKTIAMGYPPFKVELKDFGSYPSHTIFINVTSKLPIQNLVKEIKQAQRLMKLDNEHKPHFMEDPHLTIARKLVPWQYEKAWLEYSNRHFTGRFIADSMMLLKRREGDQNYQIVQRFQFMNLPVTTKQGELFG
ncbi:MAG TPA: 2'-5' RNA ligase family protein [Chitinophagaceae bacterium]|nr:2'-5' RNA ligase family protein [Chitinophagaceae bacterium]